MTFFGFPVEVILSLAVFSFVSSITPGPNNLMLLASGVNFGFLRSVPHMIGINGGFAFLLACVGFGLGQLLEASPLLYNVLRICGAVYLLYLAWKIAGSGSLRTQEGDSTPFTFLQAAAFQWVNPKAWVMAVASMTLYTDTQNYIASVIIVVAVFSTVNMPAIAAWCGLGTVMRQYLSDPKRLRTFNIIMAVLLVLTLWPMLK